MLLEGLKLWSERQGDGHIKLISTTISMGYLFANNNVPKILDNHLPSWAVMVRQTLA